MFRSVNLKRLMDILFAVKLLNTLKYDLISGWTPSMPGHYKHHLRFILHVGPMYLNLNLINIIFNPFSAGTVFRRQNLTSKDVRFWRLKTIV